MVLNDVKYNLTFSNFFLYFYYLQYLLASMRGMRVCNQDIKFKKGEISLASFTSIPYCRINKIALSVYVV